MSNLKVLDNSILDCFVLSIMVQFCARWAARIQVELDRTRNICPRQCARYALLFIEMWRREVAGMTTEWMTAGYLSKYFTAASRLFPGELKRSWNDLITWLKSSQSEEYRSRIRSGLYRIRTGQG